MPIKALILNCTLKRSPEPSNTRVLIDKVIKEYDTLGVQSEVIRVVDHQVKFGITNDAGEGDAWPAILEKIKASDILIIASPIWFGSRSSICQLVMERLDATFSDADEETGQYPLYGKVAGIIVTGNEDGAHHVGSYTLYNLMHLGLVVPPNCDTYWVGEAGAGPNYAEAGQEHLYTNKTLRFLAHNTAWFAQLMRQNPIPTNLKELTEAAKAVSKA